MMSRLTHVAAEEGVALSDESAATLIHVSGGDLRRAINVMQSAFQLYGDEFGPEGIIEVSGVFPESSAQNLWRSIRDAGFDGLRRQVDDIMANGYPLAAVLERVRGVFGDEGMPAERYRVVCVLGTTTC